MQQLASRRFRFFLCSTVVESSKIEKVRLPARDKLRLSSCHCFFSEHLNVSVNVKGCKKFYNGACDMVVVPKYH